MSYLAKVYLILGFWVLALNYWSKADNANAKNRDICKSQYDGAILPNSNDCHKFYICVNQQAHEYNCDPSYHFDKTTRSCKPGAACNENNNKPTDICTEGTVRAVQDDCYIFEACIGGHYQKINCPVNYYFYKPNLMCVPFKYDAQFKCSCLMPQHTVLENKNNCETYYKCEDKAALLQNCPLGQYYNSQLNACIPDVEGVCLMKPTMIPGIPQALNKLNKDLKDLNNIETECKLLGSQGVNFQTFPSDCNTFYICINGQIYKQQCPQDFYYDSDKKYCVIDIENKCEVNDEVKAIKRETNNIQDNQVTNLNDQAFNVETKLFSKIIKF